MRNKAILAIIFLCLMPLTVLGDTPHIDLKEPRASFAVRSADYCIQQVTTTSTALCTLDH